MKTDLITQPPLLQKFFEPENPQHFINLIPDYMRVAILNIPESLLVMSEKEIIVQAFPNGEIPQLDQLIRLSFWQEYNECFETQRKMSANKICKGVCPHSTLTRDILSNPKRTAFMITEPSEHKKMQMFGHHLAINEMIKTLTRPEEVNLKTGCVDTKLLQLKFDIYTYLDERLHGSTIQRTEQKTLNVNVEAQPEQVGLPATTEEIDKRLKQLEEELSLPPAQNPIRVLSPMDKVSIEDGNVEHAEFKRKPKVVYD